MTTGIGRRGTLRTMFSADLLMSLVLALAPLAQESPTNPKEVVAKAALLEQVQGDAAGAEALLRQSAAAAEAAGDHAARIEFVRALTDLLLRQGRVADAAAALGELPGAGREPAAAGAQDPVQVMLSALDTGTVEDRAVSKAMRQLAAVGDLAVPAVLARLDGFGPFGRSNALNLLLQQWSPAVRVALLERVRQGDAFVAGRLVGSLSHEGVDALLVARVLAEHADEATRVSAFEVLSDAHPVSQEAETLARQLARSSDATVRRRAAAALPRAPWARQVAQGLLRDADAEVRSLATSALVRQLGDDEQDLALEMLRGQPDALRRAARLVLESRPRWLRVAAEALPHAENWGLLIQQLPWRDEPELAVRTLAPWVGDEGVWPFARDHFETLSATGWRLPPELDDLMVAAARARPGQIGSIWFALLPDDGDARVAAHLDDLPEQDRFKVADAIKNSRRPWHRFMVAVFEKNRASMWVLDRDWSGASPDVVDRLVRIARGGDRAIRDTLLKGMQVSTRPPMDVVLELFADPHTASTALQIALRVDPRRAVGGLERVGDLDALMASNVVALLPHFTPADLPTLLRVARETGFFASIDGGDDLTARMLISLGNGDLRVVALAQLPSTGDSREWGARCMAARGAAVGVAAADVAAAVQLLPQLEVGVATILGERISEIAEAGDVDALVRALEQAWSHGERLSPDENRRPMPRKRLVATLVSVLRRIGALARPALQTALAQAPEWAAQEVAAAALAVAGDEATGVARGLLTSERHALVQAALNEPFVAADPELRDLALAAIVKLAPAQADRANEGIWSSLYPNNYLGNLPRELRIATGKRLLETVDVDAAADTVLTAALRAAGEAKTAEMVPLLAKFLHHASSEVRIEVTQQFGRMLDRAAVPSLLLLLKDDAPQVVQAAKEALEKLARYEEFAGRFK